jgi:hypothetical protein
MAVTDLRGRAGFQLNRFKVISGRVANPRAPGEAMTDFPTADREGLRVGSVIKYIVGDPGAKRPKLAAVRIVGVVASPGQFPAVGASAAFSSVYVTPAFVRSNHIRPSPGDAALLIRLRRGVADREAFLRHKAAAGLGEVDVPFVQQVQTAGIQRSIRLESQALWALSVLIGLAAFAVVGQSLARQTYLESADFPALRALGFPAPSCFRWAWCGPRSLGWLPRASWSRWPSCSRRSPRSAWPRSPSPTRDSPPTLCRWFSAQPWPLS